MRTSQKEDFSEIDNPYFIRFLVNLILYKKERKKQKEQKCLVAKNNKIHLK